MSKCLSSHDTEHLRNLSVHVLVLIRAGPSGSGSVKEAACPAKMHRHVMERHCACSRRLWIIEYAFAHNMMDIIKDMEASFLLDEDWEPLRLDESWRVRVTSAQVFSIVKNRQISRYERVLTFLENTHALLPTLVPSIKHMKITFGLKTMVIMWMLREGAGPVDLVQKISKYFPRKLPQYQEHCRKHEMILMRQNLLDFRTFAQSLIMDKQKLEDYIQNHLEEQYGDHYAQKTEERLLSYLQELDKALPKGTYIDKIMKKNSPVNEAEKVLLDLITKDSKTIATTLKALLRCDTAFCDSLHKSKLGAGVSQHTPPESHVHLDVSKDQLAAERSAVGDALMKDVDEPEQAVAVCTDRSKETAFAGAMETGESRRKSRAHVVKVAPHFCSKHQRWVRNILCECPGESSEDSDISPQLFTSSSSDLTPSNLTLPAEQRQSPSATAQELQEEGDAVFDEPVSAPLELGLPSHPAPTEVQTFIPASAVKVITVQSEMVTSVTVCPLKTSTTSTKASSTFKTDTKNTDHQTVPPPKTFISKLSRAYRLGQKHSKSKITNTIDPGSKNVEYSAQRSFNMLDPTNVSARTTSNSRSCSPDHTGSGTFKSMQPCVVLKRMSTEECLNATQRRSSLSQCDGVEEHIDLEVSFDVNSLFSSSSSSEDEDSDTEYRPHRNTLRKWSLGL